MKVNHSQAANLIQSIGANNTILLRGQPGIGKSDIFKSLKSQLPDHHFCYVDVANLDLGDLGMPVIDRDAMTTSYAPNVRFGVGKNQTKPVVLMLDELGKASRPVLNMLLPVLLEHRFGNYSLRNGSIVFGTTNQDTDGVGDNIPAHAFNRMTVVTMANPTSEEWLQWAANNNVAPEIMAFAHQTPEIFDCYADLDSKTKNPYIFNPLTGNTKAFCSPRSLVKAGNIISQRAVLGDATLPALAGTIGESAARQMDAIINMADQLPSFKAICLSPSTTKVPKTAGALFLMAFMLAGKVTEDTMDAVMEYAQRMSTESFEAHALFIMSLATNTAKVGMACRNRSFTTAAAKLGKFF